MIIHQHATCDHLIPTFFLKRPKSARLDVWRLPGLRPRPRSFLASTAAPLLSNSSAAATWPLSAAACSGVQPQALFPGKPVGAAVGFRRRRRRRGRGAVGGRRTLWACGALYPFNRQRNDECFGLHIFKTVHIHKHIGQVSIHLFYNITFDEKNTILTAFSMMMRPVRTMSSIR